MLSPPVWEFIHSGRVLPDFTYPLFTFYIYYSRLFEKSQDIYFSGARKQKYLQSEQPVYRCERYSSLLSQVLLSNTLESFFSFVIFNQTLTFNNPTIFKNDFNRENFYFYSPFLIFYKYYIILWKLCQSIRRRIFLKKDKI